MSSRDTFELRIPADLIQAAQAKFPSPQSDEDWHQCDVVDCGRWYQRMRPVSDSKATGAASRAAGAGARVPEKLGRCLCTP